MPEPRLAAIYARISDEDDRTDKVGRQDQILQQLCRDNEYTVFKVYEDNDLSAFKPGVHRPGFEELVSDIEAGRFQVLVFSAQDRLTRNHIRPLILLEACREAGILWHTIRHGLVDTSARTTQVMAFLEGWQSEGEIIERSERQRDAFEHRRSQGLPLWGIRPFGYQLDRMRLHPTESIELKNAYEVVLFGGSVYSIVKDWNERGVLPTTQSGAPQRLAKLMQDLDGRMPSEKQQQRIAKMRRHIDSPRGWSYATVVQLLRRPRNAGFDLPSASTTEGTITLPVTSAKWEPVVTPEVWQRACKVLAEPSRRKSVSTAPRWLLAGIATCGLCGAPMRSGTGSDRQVSRPVYRCGSKRLPPFDGKRHPTIGAPELDKLMSSKVVSRFLHDPPNADASSVRAPEARELQQLHEKRAALRQQKRDLQALLGDEGWDLASLRKRMSAVVVAEDDVTHAIETVEKRSARAAMLSELQGEIAKAWTPPRNELGERRLDMDVMSHIWGELERRFEALPIDQRRVLVRALFTVTVYNGRGLGRVDVQRTDGRIQDEDGATP